MPKVWFKRVVNSLLAICIAVVSTFAAADDHPHFGLNDGHASVIDGIPKHDHSHEPYELHRDALIASSDDPAEMHHDHHCCHSAAHTIALCDGSLVIISPTNGSCGVASESFTLPLSPLSTIDRPNWRRLGTKSEI